MPSHFKRLCLSVEVLVLATVLISSCKAQQRYLLEETTAAPGKGSAFIAAQADYCAAVVRGGAPACTVFTPTTFSPGNLYFTLLSFSSFQHYDEGTYTSRGLTKEQATELQSRRGPTISSNRESALSLLEPVSYTTKDAGALVLIVDITVRPGTSPSLQEYMRSFVLPESHRTGMLSSELYQVVLGGDTNRFLLVRRFQHFAQLDGITPFGDGGRSASSSHAGVPDWLLSSRSTVMRVGTGDNAQ